MTFKPWDIAKAGFTLPIRGKQYTIAPIGYLDEIKIKAWFAEIQAARTEKRLPDMALLVTDEQFTTANLGADVLKQMHEDNVPGIVITHATAVAHTFNTEGREAAEKAWAEGLDPEALAASMKAAQAALMELAQTASQQSPNTESASPTRSANTTGTTSPKVTPRSAPAKKAAPSRGRRSSPAKP